MPPAAPIASSVAARVIHAALVTGVVLFLVIAWYVGDRQTVPADALPDRRLLYLALTLLGAGAFGAAMLVASRMVPRRQMSQEEWWRANLSRAITCWALLEAPTLFGTAIYLLTRDFRTLLATFIGLFLFLQFRPGRLADRV
jgi:hypothetical protein